MERGGKEEGGACVRSVRCGGEVKEGVRNIGPGCALGGSGLGGGVGGGVVKVWGDGVLFEAGHEVG